MPRRATPLIFRRTSSFPDTGVNEFFLAFNRRKAKSCKIYAFNETMANCEPSKNVGKINLGPEQEERDLGHSPHTMISLTLNKNKAQTLSVRNGTNKLLTFDLQWQRQSKILTLSKTKVQVEPQNSAKKGPSS